MQDYTRGELERIAARPPVHVWLQEARRRTGTPWRNLQAGWTAVTRTQSTRSQPSAI